MMDDHRALHRRGVTLIEIMISLILVSTVLLVSITASANLLRNNVQRRAAVDANVLGRQIAEEVSAQHFVDPDTPGFGLETGEIATDRTTFDDVDDYHGFAATPPTHRDGSVIDGYLGWTFSISVSPCHPTITGALRTGDTAASLREIRVTCVSPEGVAADTVTLVSNVPSNRSESTSFEKWRRVTLGFSDRNVVITTPLRNQPDQSTTP